jgi:hypothetical protein
LVWPALAPAGTYSVTVQSQASNTQDSYLVQDNQTERNGTKNDIRIKASDNTKNRHLVLDPPLPLLSGKTVLQAWLKLTEYGASSSTPMDTRVYPLLEPWTEPDVCYRYRAWGAAWATPGGTAGPYWAGRALVSDANNGGQVSWQVGPIVSAWLNGDLTKHGFVIEPLHEGADREVVFRSSEYTNTPTDTPQLVISYTDEPPAIRSGYAELQPSAVQVGATNTPLSLWLDVNSAGTTSSGTATGLDVITLTHGGALSVTGIDALVVGGTLVNPSQITWYDTGNSLTVRFPNIQAQTRIELRFRANVLAPATTYDLELPLVVDDSATLGCGSQMLWPGNADGTPGNGDAWTLAVTANTPIRVDLTPDPISVVSRLCTTLQLFAEDSQGNRFAVNADSVRVTPATLGTIDAAGRFCGNQPGTGTIKAFYGSLRDSSHVTVTPALLPSISQIVLRDRMGASVNALAPSDTMFLDVTLADGDGFKDITGLDLSLYYQGHPGDTGAPAYHALYRWRRGALPSWSLVEPMGTSWVILPAQCAIDTVTNSTSPQTARLAFVPGRIARATSAGLWSVGVTVPSATPPDTAAATRSSIDCATRFELASADTAGAFNSGRPGALTLPLRLPADGSLTLTLLANTDFLLRAAVQNFGGTTSPSDTLRVDSPTQLVSWSLTTDPGAGGRLSQADTTITTFSAATTESAVDRALYLWVDYPVSAPAQDYRGALNLSLAPAGGGAPASPLAIPLTATVAGAGQAAESGMGELLPHAVQVGTIAQSFTAYLLPDLQLGDSGIDRIQVHVSSGYGAPAVTSVRVAGLPVGFTDVSQAGRAEVLLASRVVTNSLIEVGFQADTPTVLDTTGQDFVIFFDDAGTPLPPQAANQGDANGIADGNSWRVTVGPGPVARVTISPDSASCYVDSVLAYTATAEDAYGNPLTPAITWSALGGVGTINPTTGVFSATAAGAGRVVATTSGVSDTATVRPARGIQIRTIRGPSSAYQGEPSALVQALIVNLGADSVSLDTLGLVFTRAQQGDGNADFRVVPAVGSPGGIHGSDSVWVSFATDVGRNAATGTLVVDARAVATERSSGTGVKDEGADETVFLTVTTGGMTVSASQNPGMLRPGDRGKELLAITVTNLYPVARTLRSLTLRNASTGAGSQDELDGELGDLTLFRDAGDGVFTPSTDAPLLATVALDGSVNFTPLGVAVPAQGSIRLFVAADIPLLARDGDVLDLSLADSTAIGFDPASFARNAWALDPVGGHRLDGMTAAQIGITPAGPANLLAGSSNNRALEVLVPPNGYEEDVLQRLAVVNHGTADPQTDIRGVNAWADDGDGSFDPARDRSLGALYFTGDRWQRTGLSERVPLGGLRIFFTVGISDLAVEGRTVLLALPEAPAEGVGTQSGDNGPLDQAVENSYALPISTVDRVTITATSLPASTVRPGQRGAVLLHLVLANSYADARTMTRLVVTNRTAGPGSAPERDREIQVVTLREDRNDDGVLEDLGSDPALGAEFFSNGRASFSGLQWTLPPGSSRHLFVVGDVSRTEAADADTLSASVNGATDVDFAEFTSVASAWPVSSGARRVVDGLSADQITDLGVPGVSLGPGDGPVLALDVVIPRNGYVDDELHGFRVVNLGNAGTGDIAELRLWRDGGDGLFTPGSGDDADLGALTYLSGAWVRTSLTEGLAGAGARLFVSLTASAAPAESATVRLAIPIAGIDNASGNDGPLERAVENPQALTISTSPLLAVLETATRASTVGQPIQVRMIVRNAGVETVTGIRPTALAASGAATAALSSGPVPATFDLAPAQRDTFTWTYVSTSEGDLIFSGSAAGTGATSGVVRRAVQTASNRHDVFVSVIDADLVPVQSMPTNVSRGQIGVVPLSLTFTNNGGTGASDVRLLGLTLRLEDQSGAGVVPADLLARVLVGEGTTVYLTKTSLEISGSDVALTLATPALVTPEQPTTLSLRLDIADSTLVPSFRLVISDSTRIVAEDATSGAPVIVRRTGGSFPLRSGTARLVANATRLDLEARPALERRVPRGALDVSALSLRATSPGIDAITSDVRVSTLGITICDTTGAPMPQPSSRIRRLVVHTALQTMAAYSLRPTDGPDFLLALSPPLTVPVNTPLDFTVAADIADSATLGAFSIRLRASSTLEARDANTLDSVQVVYAASPLAGGPVIVEAPADRFRVAGIGLFPPSIRVGDTGVPALRIVLRHPGVPGTARLRLDSLGMVCRDELRRVLAPGSYLDRVRVLWNGVEIADATGFPPAPGPATIPLGSPALAPGDSAVVLLLLDVRGTAPSSYFELTVGGAGLAVVDVNSGTPALAEAEPGTDLPLSSGLTHLDSPPRELLVGLTSRMPAAIVSDGREVVAGVLRLANTAAPGSGDISLDHLVLRASDHDLRAEPLGGAVGRVTAYVGGNRWAQSAPLTSDSTTASLAADTILAVPPGVPVDVELRIEPVTVASGSSLRIGIDASDIGVVQPASALLAVAVRPESGSAFPLWTEVASFSPRSLKDSYSNFPNPFAAGREPTAFVFYMPKDGYVTLRIWTPSGQRVATVVDRDHRTAGLQQSDAWTGRNGVGDVVRNGVYVAELVARYDDGSGERVLRKVAIVR